MTREERSKRIEEAARALVDETLAAWLAIGYPPPTTQTFRDLQAALDLEVEEPTARCVYCGFPAAVHQFSNHGFVPEPETTVDLKDVGPATPQEGACVGPCCVMEVSPTDDLCEDHNCHRQPDGAHMKSLCNRVPSGTGDGR